MSITRLDDVCSVCCGEPKSVDRCICEGTGTLAGELIGLRLECIRLRAECRALVEAVESMIDEEPEAVLPRDALH